MRIRELRIAAGLSPEELAEAMGVCRTAVVQWETGVSMPKSAILPKLATALKCTIDDLYRKEETA